MRVAAWFLGAAIAGAIVTPACTIGQGSGTVQGTLNIPACGLSNYAYDMQPNFFGATEAQNQMLIRIQKGGDYQEYSDSLTIAVQDITRIPPLYDQPIPIALERPPGSPVDLPPPLVRMTLALRRKRSGCSSEVFEPATDAAQIALEAVSGTITFHHILEGDPNSRDTNSKRIEATFTVDNLEDPRGWGAPQNVGTLHGSFKFFYQVGGPAQPFP